MDTPLELTYHHVLPSERLERYVRENVGKLEHLYPHMIGCRVSVELPHRHHRTGNFPEVHVEIRIPGHKVVARNEPHHSAERRRPDTLLLAVRLAFRAAVVQLKNFKERQRRRVAAAPATLVGTVASLEAEKNYGFIRTQMGDEIHFHRNSMSDNGFESLRAGDRVEYTVAVGDKGSSAARVWRSRQDE